MFTFPINTEELFEERSRQFNGWGIPSKKINEVRRSVTDMWLEGPGGWAYEWCKQGEKAEKSKRWLLASACYGAAKFPSLCTPYRQDAYEKQIACYLRAAKYFPCRFERTAFEVPYGHELTSVAAHIYQPPISNATTPVVLLTGGVDTHKMELHRLILGLVIMGGFKVVAIDMPGTGESNVPLKSDSDVIYRGVIDAIREDNPTKIGMIGMIGLSFGGHWAAKLALLGSVDAVINLGGPIGASSREGEMFNELPNGMIGIVANAMGHSQLPSNDEAETLVNTYSLKTQGLLGKTKTPLLAINGSEDQYISQADTTEFLSYENAEVWLIKNSTHCAAEKIKHIAPGMISWLRRELHGDTLKNRLMIRGSELILNGLKEENLVKAS